MGAVFLKKREIDIVNGKLSTGILFVGMPLMLTNVLQVLFNMSDIAIVGRFSGAEALGCVGSTSMIVALFTGILIIGIGSSINVIVAQCLGKGDNRETHDCVHTCFITALVGGVIVMLISLSASGALLKVLGTKEELEAGARHYMAIYSFGFPALAVYNYGNGVLSAAGNTKIPLYILFISGIINVILNLFFVIVLKMSVDGVALASVISLYISAVVITLSLVRSDTVYKLHLRNIKVNRVYIKKVTALGIPGALQSSIFSFANLFIQAGINKLDTVMVEGNAVASNVDTLVFNIMESFYTAGSSFIGQNFGAGKKKRIKKSYFISTGYALISALVSGIVLFFFGRSVLSIFTTDPEVIDAAMLKLNIMRFSYLLCPFMDNTITASRGIGKSFMPTAIVVTGSCVFRIFWVYTVFARFMTVPSLYIVYPISWAITAIAEIIYFMYAFKKLTKNMA